MGGSGGVIDPPPGAPFRDPVIATNQSTLPGIVEVTLELKRTPVNVNGTVANLMAYNGCFPGPTIRVHRGDKLLVHLKNSLPYTTSKNMLGFEKNHTNLHTHGWHVSPREPADAAHLDIPAGGHYDYEYDLAHVTPGALSFYHTHRHGLVAEQHWAGAAGALVAEDETAVLAGFETHIMVLKDISLSGSEPTAYTMTSDYMHGKEGTIVMVNGMVNPVIHASPGQVQRWRIVNASNARFYNLSLSGHSLNLIGTDGGLLDRPHSVPSILLSPGERIDVLVKVTNDRGTYKFLSLPYSRIKSMSSARITLLTLSCSGAPQNQNLPVVINPGAMRMSMDLSMLPKRTLTLSMGRGRGYINGQDFDVAPCTIMSTLGMPEVWEIINDSDMDHPFHQHVNAAMVLTVMGGDPAYAETYTTLPAWKDVVIVPKRGRVTMLVPVDDYTGMTMFHCHILEHEDIGMMGMWHLMDPMSLSSLGSSVGEKATPTSANPEGEAQPGAPSIRLDSNPARGSVRLEFALAAPSDVDLRLYDVRGRLVGVLASGPFSPGKHRLEWSGDQRPGGRLAGGIYFARMRTTEVTLTRKVFIVP